MGWRVGLVLVFGGMVVLGLLVHLETAPAVWWDEGWTLNVARTFVERGVYARLLNGEPAARGLEAAFPFTGLVALSFQMFGIGVGQARGVSVLFTLASLPLLYGLGARLFNRKVGLASLVVLFVFSMHPQTHPLVMGREVLGEPMMLFLLLAGYLGLWSVLRGQSWLFPLVVGMWAVALITKAQSLPMWTASLCVAFGVALIRKSWRQAAWVAVAGLGAYVLSDWIVRWTFEFVIRQTISGKGVEGLVGALGFVPDLRNRWMAVTTLVEFELPLLVGLGYGVWRWVSDLTRPTLDTAGEIIRSGLLAITGSWVAWYLLLANAGVPRYLYPATFIGSLFVARLMSDLTNGFDLAGSLRALAEALRLRRFDAPSRRAFGALALFTAAVPFTLVVLGWFYSVVPDDSPQQVAAFLNTLPAGSGLIESYDPELFFFLERPYHYPPDQTHVDLIRRTLDPAIVIRYDPLQADPGYIVVGPFGKGWHLYDSILASGRFRLLRTWKSYVVYERAN